MPLNPDFRQGDQDNPDDEQNIQVLGGAIVAPDGTQVDLSPEQAAAVLEAKKQADLERKNLVEELVTRLVEKREQCIKARRDIERRWIDDQRQWDGADRLLNTKEFPSQTNNDNMMPPRPHLTRARCDIWESRGIDLIAPTDDPTWELVPMTFEDISPPQGVDPTLWAQGKMELQHEMEIRAQKMRDVIKDQLGACDATMALRRMVVQAMRVGAGLVMGPMNGTHVRRHYSGDPNNPVQMIFEELTVPTLQAGDIWCFYPEMVDRAENASYAFYLNPMNELQLWEFSNLPGVDKDEIDKLLDERPDYGEVEVTLRERNRYSGLKETTDGRHAVWRFTGIIDRKYCEALGLETNDGPISADIWFCNRHILKSKLTVLARAQDFRIPYYVFSPFPIDDSMFGASIAYLCRDSQRTATASWLMMLHNISVSSGPQIVIRKGAVTPADGKYSLRGPKVWEHVNEDIPIDDAFASFNIANNAEQAANAFQMAKEMLDEELNTAQWASPDTSDVTQTASGLAMLMNARTILQRRVCACADDDVIGPFIQRFVLWNMLYNKREDIKGDFDVRPLCQSVRLVKDIRIQQKLFALQTFVFNPNTGSMFDPYDSTSDVLRDMDIHADNWMKPKQQWQQEQQQAAQQPQDPRAQAAQANAQLAYAKTQTEQMKQRKMQADILQGNQGPDQGTMALEHQAALQKHAMDKQVEIQGFNTNLTIANTTAQSRQYAADAQLQARREGIAADLLKAHTKNIHDMIRSGQQRSMGVPSMPTHFTPGPSAPKRPAGKFTPPAVPKFHRGKG